MWNNIFIPLWYYIDFPTALHIRAREDLRHLPVQRNNVLNCKSNAKIRKKQMQPPPAIWNGSMPPRFCMAYGFAKE